MYQEMVHQLKTLIMLGGSLSRYHTPTTSQGGGGMAEDLIKIAGLMEVSTLNQGVQRVQRGARADQALKEEAMAVKRNLKRKSTAIAGQMAKGMAKRRAMAAYKRMVNPLSRVRDIFS